MKYLSLFTGIGVFDKALDAAGFECALQCEIDRDCVRVLKRHWPNVKRIRDVRRVKVQPGAGHLVCGGTPCQDLSVAGRRAGLAGKRSGLFHEFVRVADSSAAPWLLWENVAGAFSSHGGKDFAEVLYAITGFRPEVPEDGWRNAGVCIGPKRSAAWRVLDAQSVGGCPLHMDEFGIGPVPQRRRRVFIVAHTVERTYPARVLFEPESLPGHFEACEEERPRVAAQSGGGADGGCKTANASDYANGQFEESDTVSPITTSADRSRAAPVVYPCLRSNIYNNSDPGMEASMLIAHTLRAEGSDASEDGTGRGVPLVVNALDAHMGMGGQQGVRRLMPVECERLMGLPDDWTRWSFDGTEIKDSPRYRMIGNSIAYLVALWIVQRIAAADR